MYPGKDDFKFHVLFAHDGFNLEFKLAIEILYSWAQVKTVFQANEESATEMHISKLFAFQMIYSFVKA